jgi:phosphoribosylanthranilate isomerase
MTAQEPWVAAAAAGAPATTVQVKVCGLTRVEEAVACAEMGAAAVGCVFYAKSPRRVTTALAREIRRALPPGVACVGVFVDEPLARMVAAAVEAGLSAVQLHGNEPPSVAAHLGREGLVVMKALFAEREPHFDRAAHYRASAFLVECGRGVLPGGNALAWEWAGAAGLAGLYPVILAGGLTPDNVAQAVRAAGPDAVDVSSGVESAPGRKDLRKVADFIAAVSDVGARRRIFA